jgi:nucleotide-binding universal stress UspA family protein
MPSCQRPLNRFGGKMTQAYSKILVPLDGSEFGERALAPALALARKSQGELHLVSAVSSLPLLRPADADKGDTKGWFAEEGARVAAYLEQVRGRIQEEHPDQVVRVHSRVGGPAPSILRRIEEVHADLVVMTTHGRSALGRAWLGSVADGVVRQAHCPVLLLRPEEEEAPLDLARIMVSLDGSDASERALGQARLLAGTWGSKVDLVSVIPTPHSVAVPYLDASAEAEEVRQTLEADFREYLGRTATSLRETGVTVETQVVRAQDVPAGLLGALKRSEAGLLVMSTQGRGGVARLILGSVANRMIRSAPVPVLVVPPGRKESLIEG